AAKRGNITTEFNIWSGMRRRCSKPNRHNYFNYGGRGIKVCERWQQSFKNFLHDMGPRPSGKSLDRINNNLGYSPENCRWATPSQQINNRRNSILITHNGQTLPLSEWAKNASVSI